MHRVHLAEQARIQPLTELVNITHSTPNVDHGAGWAMLSSQKLLVYIKYQIRFVLSQSSQAYAASRRALLATCVTLQQADEGVQAHMPPT
jgi:hypothetical protein